MEMPSIMDPVDSLLDLIQTEERRLLSTFSLERRIGLFELVRAADEWFAATQLSPGRGSELDQRSADQLDEAAGLLSFGLNKALQLFVDDSCLKDGAPLFASDPAFQRWANPALFWCGRLGYCQRVLELCRVGLAEITRSGPKKYQVRMTAERVGAEALEAAEFLRFLLSDQQQSNLQSHGLRPINPNRSLESPIDPAYGADPDANLEMIKVPGTQAIDAVVELWKCRLGDCPR